MAASSYQKPISGRRASSVIPG